MKVAYDDDVSDGREGLEEGEKLGEDGEGFAVVAILITREEYLGFNLVTSGWKGVNVALENVRIRRSHLRESLQHGLNTELGRAATPDSTQSRRSKASNNHLCVRGRERDDSISRADAHRLERVGHPPNFLIQVLEAEGSEKRRGEIVG
jgi:hypothetical protein